MSIIRIDIRGNDEVRECITCVTELYLRHVSKFPSQKINYINIYLVDDSAKEGDIKVTSNFLDCFYKFDFEFYLNLSDNYNKKKYLTQSVHAAMLKIAEIYSWDANNFENAYSKCAELNFCYEGYFGKKLFASPDKKYYFGLRFFNDIDIYEIHEELFDGKKNPVSQRVCFRDNVKVFSIEKIWWDENSEIVYYRFNGPEKIFKSRLKELLLGKPYDLPATTSKYFKDF